MNEQLTMKMTLMLAVLARETENGIGSATQAVSLSLASVRVVKQRPFKILNG
jgi:hypothetical protein